MLDQTPVHALVVCFFITLYFVKLFMVDRKIRKLDWWDGAISTLMILYVTLTAIDLFKGDLT